MKKNCSNPDCGEEFDTEEFEQIDCEYDEDENLCPSCQDAHELKGKECEFCDKTASNYAYGHFYCTECYEDFLDQI